MQLIPLSAITDKVHAKLELTFPFVSNFQNAFPSMNRRYVPFSEISWKMRWMSAGNAKILLLLSASAPGKKAGILH